jgi:hypothetical protein
MACTQELATINSPRHAQQDSLGETPIADPPVFRASKRGGSPSVAFSSSCNFLAQGMQEMQAGSPPDFVGRYQTMHPFKIALRALRGVGFAEYFTHLFKQPEWLVGVLNVHGQTLV